MDSWDRYNSNLAGTLITTGNTNPDEIDNPASGSVTFTLDGLQRNQLYAISVQATAGNRKESFWSEPVYVYPTALVPAGTGGAVTATATVRVCDDAKVGDEFKNKTKKNVVKIATKVEIIMMGCLKPRAAGCASSWATSDGAHVATRIAVLESVSFKEDNGCSEAIRVVLHEAGHAYGLLHAVALHHKTLMRPVVSNTALCDLYEYDKVAIKAIYQSRTVSVS